MSNFVLRRGNINNLLIGQIIVAGLIYWIILIPVLNLLFEPVGVVLSLWGYFIGLRTYIVVYLRKHIAFKLILVSFFIPSLYVIITKYYLSEFNPIFSYMIYELLIILIIICICWFRKYIKFNIGWSTISKQLEYNEIYYLLLLSVFSSLITYSDRFILNLLLGASQVSIFFIITLIPKLIPFLGSIFNGVVFSYLNSIQELENKEAMLMLWPVFALLLVCSIVIAIIGIYIIPLIYKDFSFTANYYWIYFISIFAYFLSGVDKVLRGVIMKFSTVDNLINQELIFLIIQIVFCFILLNYYQSLVALSVALLLIYTIRVFLTKKLFNKTLLAK